MLDFTIDRFVKNKNVLIEENDKVFKIYFKQRILSAKTIPNYQQKCRKNTRKEKIK